MTLPVKTLKNKHRDVQYEVQNCLSFLVFMQVRGIKA